MTAREGAYFSLDSEERVATDSNNLATVIVDQHGRFLVSDSGNGGVKVFDKNGQFILKIGHKDNSKLTCPMGICQDMSGNVLNSR